MSESIIENRGLFHKARTGYLSYVDMIDYEPTTEKRAALSFWYQPAPLGGVQLSDNTEYLTIACLRSIPQDRRISAWSSRVIAFARRYKKGIQLSSNWGMPRFERSSFIDVGEEMHGGLGFEILILNERIELEIITEAYGSLDSVGINVPRAIDLKGLEMRLGNPGDGSDPGENDRDPRSIAEPGAEWSGLRFEMLNPGGKMRGLMNREDARDDPDVPRGEPNISHALRLLTMAENALKGI